jgi:AsmA protein
MKALKYGLIGLVAVLLLAVAAAAYLAATFDPNEYKPQIIQLVKDRTQRNLALEGDIKLSFWPSIGAEVAGVSLSEPNSDRQFAAMERARVSLKLRPLLSRTFVVDDLSIKGLSANIVRTKSGRTNVDDLIGAQDKKQPEAEQQAVRFDIAEVEIDNATLTYRDEATGANYALSGLTLKTGRVAPDVPTKIELKTTTRSNQPKMDLVLDGRSRLTFNLDAQTYRLDDLALEVKGDAAGYTGIAARAGGSLSANLKTNEFATEKLTANGTAMQGKDKVAFKLDAPRLAMTADKASGEKVTATFTVTSPDGATNIAANVPGIEGTSRSFRAPAMAVDLERRQADQTLKARLTSPVSGNIEAMQFSLPQLKAAVTISGPNLPGSTLSGELAGNATVDATKKTAQTQLAGKIGDSNVKARVAIPAFSPLRLDFGVEVDQLDLARYTGTGPGSKGEKGGKPPAAKKPDEPIDVTALRDLRASGSLRIGMLKTTTISASNVRVDVKANGGQVDLNPVAANLYQGNVSGAVSINAAPATPTFAVKQTLTGVQVGPLLRDLAETDTLEGRGNVALNVTAQGNTVSALKKALNGSVSVKLTDGAIKGIDLAGQIRRAQTMLSSLRGEQVQQSDTGQRTDFTELTATFDIRNGVARNNDLSIKSPLLRIGGAGVVNIGEDTVDYTVKASVVASIEGQGGRERTDLRGLTIPVRVTGPIDSPSYRLDFDAVVTDTARQKIEEAVTKRLEERLGGKTPKPEEGQSGRRLLEESVRGLLRR